MGSFVVIFVSTVMVLKLGLTPSISKRPRRSQVPVTVVSNESIDKFAMLAFLANMTFSQNPTLAMKKSVGVGPLPVPHTLSGSSWIRVKLRTFASEC